MYYNVKRYEFCQSNHISIKTVYPYIFFEEIRVIFPNEKSANKNKVVNIQ